MEQERRQEQGQGRRQEPAILVLDDEFDIVAIFRQALHKQGFSVFGFTDPLLALEHFRLNASDYSLVISDVRMPQMNGFEFAASVKRIKPDVKVVMMSAFEISDMELAAARHAACMDDFMRKPVEAAALVQKVRAAMAG